MSTKKSTKKSVKKSTAKAAKAANILRNSRVFEVTRLTEEDKNRTQMYRDNQERKKEKNMKGDYRRAIHIGARYARA